VNQKPARPADERVVVPPAGSAPVSTRSSRSPGLAPSRRGIGRLPSRLAGDVHASGPARLAPSRARFVALEALLLPVAAV